MNLDIWDRVFKNQEWGRYPAESLIRFTAKNYYHKDRKKINILEVGCGSGPNVRYFAREGFNAYGIDISSIAIEKAGKIIEEEGLAANLLVGNIEKIPYSDSFFDCVIDNECLYCNNLENTKIILRDISRVLKVGGLLYSRTFADDMYVGRTQTQISDFEFDDVSDGPFVNKGYTRLINQNGITKLYGQFFHMVSIDRLISTLNNDEIVISEWIIVCQK